MEVGEVQQGEYMVLRNLTPEDIEPLKKIHAEFFSHEFGFHEFFNAQLLQGVVAVSNTNEIIAVGGLRSILEETIIQNKYFDVRDRREAVYKIHQGLLISAGRGGYDGIHAFIQDPKWLNHLRRFGFRETKGRSVICDT